jgi:hypothetical protein
VVVQRRRHRSRSSRRDVQAWGWDVEDEEDEGEESEMSEYMEESQIVNQRRYRSRSKSYGWDVQHKRNYRSRSVDVQMPSVKGFLAILERVINAGKSAFRAGELGYKTYEELVQAYRQLVGKQIEVQQIAGKACKVGYKLY